MYPRPDNGFDAPPSLLKESEKTQRDAVSESCAKISRLKISDSHAKSKRQTISSSGNGSHHRHDRDRSSIGKLRKRHLRIMAMQYIPPNKASASPVTIHGHTYELSTDRTSSDLLIHIRGNKYPISNNFNSISVRGNWYKFGVHEPNTIVVRGSEYLMGLQKDTVVIGYQEHHLSQYEGVVEVAGKFFECVGSGFKPFFPPAPAAEEPVSVIAEMRDVGDGAEGPSQQQQTGSN